MARLNEPAPPVESIDALKRRFIRQNREISRVNSTQSLRIRNLEAEISRLLTENIAVREQAIRSAQEAERLRSSQRVFKDVSRLKEQLETKLAEVGTLVTEMGFLPEKAKRRSSQHQRRRSGLLDIKTSPDQIQRRSRLSLGGVVAGERHLQEGRLPVIAEGKSYPRRTLERLEMDQLISDGLQPDESPELGPPPVAHFDVTEPVNYTPRVRGPANAPVEVSQAFRNNEDDIKPLPENLERRRRRRASGLIEDLSTETTATPQTATAPGQSVVAKSVVKRKFDACGDDAQEQSAQTGLAGSEAAPRSADLESPQARPRGSRFSKPGIAVTRDSAPTKDHTPKLEPAPRKVLAPKSTNSPSKAKGKPVNSKPATAKDDVPKRPKTDTGAKARGTKTSKPQLPSELQSPKAQYAAAPQEPGHDDLLPKTPADTDFLSPISTEPSARTDHPTEAALTASVEDVLGGTDGRTSRRAKGAVSYAEPSLRAKMRRPTKGFIPAVVDQSNGVQTQQQRASSTSRDASLERPATGDSSFLKTRTASVKSEKSYKGSTMAWKGLHEAMEEQASPLVNKASRSLTTKPSPSVAPKESTAPSTEDKAATELETAIENLAVFDGPDSSPHDRNSPETIAVRSRKSTRRHSSNPAGLRRVAQEFDKSPLLEAAGNNDTAGGARGQSKPQQRPSSAASLRRQSLVQKENVADLKRSASVSRLSKSSTTGGARVNGGLLDTAGVANDGGGGTGVVSERPERLAARRTSVMF